MLRSHIFPVDFLQNQFSRNQVSKSIGVPSLLYDIHRLSHSAEYEPVNVSLKTPWIKANSTLEG